MRRTASRLIAAALLTLAAPAAAGERAPGDLPAAWLAA